MSDYPYLSLEQITVDLALAQTLPRHLAFYYLALPLARDGEQLTLIMAHPENRAAVAMLESALDTSVVPVKGSGAEIRRTLNQVWTSEVAPRLTHVLCWGSSPDQAALIVPMAQTIAQAFQAQTVCLDADECNLETLLSIARDEQYGLTIIDEPAGDDLSYVLSRSSTSLLFVQGACFALRQILVILRGHSPDDHVLDWIIPLAVATQARVVLLTISSSMAHGPSGASDRLANLLSPDSEPGQHIMSCAHRLTEAGIKGQLKLYEGVPEQAIASEVARGEYDLVTLAAEAHGDFVQRVVRHINQLPANNQQPVLVIKPTME